MFVQFIKFGPSLWNGFDGTKKMRSFFLGIRIEEATNLMSLLIEKGFDGWVS